MLDAIIISDLHLGAENCEADQIVRFLDQIIDEELKTTRLILNGDVFDSSHLGRLGKMHWKVLSQLRKIAKRLEVVWICGNHDPFVEFLSILIGTEIGDEFIFESENHRILVLHGHQFDSFLDRHPVLTALGDTVYNILQRFDRSHRLARLAKQRSKTFLRCAQKVEEGAIKYAKNQKCHAVICGHTHHAESKANDTIHYHNSGCWTEKPCTYLTVKDSEVKIRSFKD